MNIESDLHWTEPLLIKIRNQSWIITK